MRYFADPVKCERVVIAARWPNGITCPSAECGSRDITTIATRGLWRCKACRRQFSVKVHTIFEDSALGFDKWLPILWSLSNGDEAGSSYEIAAALNIPPKTAWFMVERARVALQLSMGRIR